MNTCGDRTLGRGCLRAGEGGRRVGPSVQQTVVSREGRRSECGLRGCLPQVLPRVCGQTQDQPRRGSPVAQGGQEPCRAQSHQPLCPKCRLMFPQVPYGINQTETTHSRSQKVLFILCPTVSFILRLCPCYCQKRGDGPSPT